MWRLPGTLASVPAAPGARGEAAAGGRQSPPPRLLALAAAAAAAPIAATRASAVAAYISADLQSVCLNHLLFEIKDIFLV